jgi:GNAT superfamily N-acetyltransferase
MMAADIPLMIRLVQQAGWNQTESDCRRFLDLEPVGCFVAEWNGKPVGTTTTCRFGPVGWISMVLVDETMRRRGIGTRLVQHALSYLDDHHTRTVRLDATELGRPMYERLGFRAEYELDRYTGRAGGAAARESVTPVAVDQLHEIHQLDRQFTGTDRARLVDRLYHENPDSVQLVRQNDEAIGYAMHRPGRQAAQIGPAVAVSPRAGGQLLDLIISRCPQEKVFADVPCDNSNATRWAIDRGLTAQRRFVRMSRGETVREHPECIWASSGPELG